MWDSAKKPIKVRSVLQPNGMRHFIVNEDPDDSPPPKTLLQQRRPSHKTLRASPSEGDTNDKLVTENNPPFPDRQKKINTVNSSSDPDDRWASPYLPSENPNFFGVSGSRISNSKKYRGQHSRHLFHQFPHGPKSHVEVTRYPHLYQDAIDLVPVKSPVIKKLISGRVTSTGHPSEDANNNSDKNQQKGNQRNGTPSTTLCSRIMTWIDLEVKRNAVVKGKVTSGAGSLPFSSADLSIVNELLLPTDYYDQKITALLGSPPASEISSSSSASSSSGDQNTSSSCGSSSSSTCSSSTVSLPKLIPCWRKDGPGTEEGGNKAKKSVRIAEDLPRWGKMKRRLRRRTGSLNELYEEESSFSMPTTTTFNCNNGNGISKTDYYNGRGNGRKASFSSVSDFWEEKGNFKRAEGGGKEEDEDEDGLDKETDSFVVCDEKLLSSGKLQVHIFLPQTESASGRADNVSGNLSARSEDSTS